MANFTSKAIKEATIELLEERPLSEITVKDIVEKCGINRNSFYYHYSDLPSLIDEMIEECAQGIIDKYPTVDSIGEFFDAITGFATRNKRAVMHIFKSVNREEFEGHLMRISEYFVRNAIENLVKSENLSIPEENMNLMVGYHKCVCFGLIIEWLNNGMSEELAKNMKKVLSLGKELIEELAAKLQPKG